MLTANTYAMVAQQVFRLRLPAAARLSSHSLPRTRSVEQESERPDGIARSPDAPLDPFDKRHRDVSGMTDEQVQAEVKKTVAQAGARASEALGGRASMLHDDPAFHMNQTQNDSSKLKQQPFGDWATEVVGDGMKQSVKQGTQKARDALKKMFESGGGGGGVVSKAGASGADSNNKGDGSNASVGQQKVPGSSRQGSSTSGGA